MSFTYTPSGERRHLVTLQNPTAVTDNAGGYTEQWLDCIPPRLAAQITSATARNLERATANTVITQATHIVTIPYHAEVTTQTRIVFGSRVFAVTGVTNPEERNIELNLACVEAQA